VVTSYVHYRTRRQAVLRPVGRRRVTAPSAPFRPLLPPRRSTLRPTPPLPVAQGVPHPRRTGPGMGKASSPRE
jgi:hypothetical protein